VLLLLKTRISFVRDDLFYGYGQTSTELQIFLLISAKR
jgi:hypothetical protein